MFFLTKLIFFENVLIIIIIILSICYILYMKMELIALIIEHFHILFQEYFLNTSLFFVSETIISQLLPGYH